MDGSLRILVFGWYYHSNLGDNLFMDAFKHLFPKFNFVFTDIITHDNLQNVDAVFIGGGSLLSEDIVFSDPLLLDSLKNKKIFYIGVGSETNIHSTHQQLLPLAKLIAIRNSVNLNKIIAINNNTIVIPDLVYCLTPSKSINKFDKSILIMPNSLVVPSWNEPYWKHAAWNYFKLEFSQFLDNLVDKDYHINFLSMCYDIEWNDNNAAVEIINMMKNKQHYIIDHKSFIDVTQLISQYSATISQRYHGTVLSEMGNIPCLTLHHHDKLKHFNGPKLSYYGVTKDELHEQFNFTLKIKNSNILPIEPDRFNSLIQTVNYLL